jgi:hypothetical protein
VEGDKMNFARDLPAIKMPNFGDWGSYGLWPKEDTGWVF